MNRSGKWLNIIRVAVFAGLASVVCLSCSSNRYEEKIIAVEHQDETLSGEGAALVLLDRESLHTRQNLFLMILKAPVHHPSPMMDNTFISRERNKPAIHGRYGFWI